MQVCDVTKPVHFQWAADIPYLAIRVMRYKQNVHLKLR